MRSSLDLFSLFFCRWDGGYETVEFFQTDRLILKGELSEIQCNNRTIRLENFQFFFYYGNAFNGPVRNKDAADHGMPDLEMILVKIKEGAAVRIKTVNGHDKADNGGKNKDQELDGITFEMISLDEHEGNKCDEEPDQREKNTGLQHPVV